MQVLDKCQLLEAVQEKEQRLDSLGWSPCCICTLISGIIKRKIDMRWLRLSPHPQVPPPLPAARWIPLRNRRPPSPPPTRPIPPPWCLAYPPPLPLSAHARPFSPAAPHTAGWSKSLRWSESSPTTSPSGDSLLAAHAPSGMSLSW